MAASFDDLVPRLQGISIHLFENAAFRVRLTTVLTHQLIVMRTPFKSGRAISNWQVSVGAANVTQIPTYGKNRVRAQRAAIAQGLAELEVKKIAAAGNLVWITNNLPYINRLNNGHSSQAPRGFVNTSIQEVRLRMESLAVNQFTGPASIGTRRIGRIGRDLVAPKEGTGETFDQGELDSIANIFR